MALTVQGSLKCMLQFIGEEQPVAQLRCHKKTHSEEGLFRTVLASGEFEGLKLCNTSKSYTVKPARSQRQVRVWQ